MKKHLVQLTCIVFLMTGNATHAQLFINEIMSNNQSTKLDEDGDNPDWIEIYNAGSSSVSLSGYYLSDDPDTLNKWRFPSVSISGGSFKTIWCSGKNRTGTELHTNFSIGKNGESIILSNSSGTNVVDFVSCGPLPPDKSYGRLPNGSTAIGNLSDPTFNFSNNTVFFINGTISDAPAFSIPGGVFTTPQTVTLSFPDTTCLIRYTLDGSEPTIYSPIYTGPITLQSRANDTNYYSMIRTGWANHSYLTDWQTPVGNVFKVNVVRARAFKAGMYPGPIRTNTYMIDPNMPTRYGNLPLVSLVSDPRHLFNDTTGIYVPGLTYVADGEHGNYHNGWKKPANIEIYYPDGRQLINGNYTMEVGGETSQSSPQKGLNLTASENYGPAKFDYPIFENTPSNAKYIQQFDKIKLRAWGTDRRKGLLHDGFCNSFMTKTDLDYAAYQPCVVFIDGEYWGLQEIRESNRDPDYYQEHYYIDKDNPGFDMINGDGNSFYEGDAVHWDAMWNFIDNNSMSDSADFEYVKTQMDVYNFGRYCMFSIFLARGDWPNQNEAKWRPRTSDGKWKWIQWDMDNTVANNLMPWGDMFDQVLVGNQYYGPSPLLVKLLDNQRYREWFLNLHADWMNTEFLPALTINRLDSMANQLRPYFTEFQDRWVMNYTWEDRIDSMDWFLARRPKYVRRHIMETFNYPDTSRITINVSDTAKGMVRISTILLDKNVARITANVYPWTGVYFDSLPVPIEAIPKPGYRFLYWLPGGNTSRTINFTLSSDSSITAVFDIDPNYRVVLPPVINEVMSSNTSAIADNYGNYDDWLELYNPNNDTLDIAGYHLTSNLVRPDRFRIRAAGDSTKIPPHGHLIVWMDDDTEQGVLHASFKFNSTGDFIALVGTDGSTIIDSITFETLPSNTSYGRRYDGSPRYIRFPVATPQATNWMYTAESVLINEVQPSNSNTVADNYGQYEPWIELLNRNSDTIDLSGWTLEHSGFPGSVFVFPYDHDSTRIAPGQHLLLWADNQPAQGVFHLNYRLPATGTLKLRKPNRITSDSIAYGPVSIDHSFGRATDGATQWIDFASPTPGSANGNAVVYTDRLYLNEVQVQNNTTLSDNYGEFDQWFEIFNPDTDTVDIAGWKIEHSAMSGMQFQFSTGNDSTKIPPGGHMVVWADASTEQGVLHTGFSLPGSGCLHLLHPDGSAADQLCYSSSTSDHSTGRAYDGSPAVITFTVPTPRAANWIYTSVAVLINEVQRYNISTASDNYLQYDPWIELYNPSGDTIDLAGWKLSHSQTSGYSFVFGNGNDSTRIAPHSHRMIWWDQQPEQGVLHAGRILPASGCITLFRPDGSNSDNLCYVGTSANQSFGRRSDGSSVTVVFNVPTPESANWIFTTDAILFNEIQSVNLSTCTDEHGDYDPWIELFNPTVDTVDLAGWKITNDLLPGFEFVFANANDSTLMEPGGHLMIWWDQNTTQGVLHASQSIPNIGCFHLRRPDASSSDNACYVNIPADQSYGRRYDGATNWYRFRTPTPDAMNWAVTSTDVLINELQTFNTNTVHDAYGDSDSWIELYNPGNDTVDLSGWQLTCGQGTVHHFAFDNDSLVMAPMDHLLLWADGETAEGVDHIDLTLPGTSCVRLVKPTGERSDSICYSVLPADFSYGRSSDGSASWFVFTTPTPDSNNVQFSTGIDQLAEEAPLRVYPNPADGDNISFSKNVSFTLFDETGRAIGNFREVRSLNVRDLASGIYLIRTEEQESLRLILK